MKKGKLYFDVSSKSKVVIKEDGIEEKLPKGFFKDNLPANVKEEIEYEEETRAGKTSISKIIYKGKTYPSHDNIPQHQNMRNQNYANAHVQERVEAWAPYNFVDLNSKVVYPDSQNVSFSVYDHNRNSGYLEISIENFTHLLVSSGRDKDDIHDFIRIGKENTPIIPGSSLRGLIKSLIEIGSYSRMIEDENYENKYLYYRSVFSNRQNPNPLTDEYFKNMIKKERDGSVIHKIQAGYLYKNGKNFSIQPAKKDELSGSQFHRVFAKPIMKVPPKQNELDYFKINGSTVKFKGYGFFNIYFKPQRLTVKQKGPLKLYYPVVEDYSFAANSSYEKGILVITGSMGDRKHYQWIVNEKDSNAKAISVDEKIIKDYTNDKNRSDEYDLVSEVDKSKEIPCFYLTNESGTIIEIGHTGFFRVKHKNDISKAIHQAHDIKKVDLAQMIFGEKNLIASRVFFEDLLLHNYQNDSLEDNISAKILASPKATSHQLYLHQDSEQLKHWSSDSIKIRGNKLYWHKKTDVNDWRESGPKGKSHPGKFKALKPNNTFTGRIRFENLTNEELGALLFAIELPENCCHKLGMGKPYGLGTVKLSIEKLHIDDRQERYNKLIKDDGNWNLPDKKISAEKLKKDFSDYMLEKLGEKSKSSLWDVDRMKELKTMLEYDEKEMAEDAWLKETAYMDLQEFRKRNVLPKPSEVLALAKKKK